MFSAPTLNARRTLGKELTTSRHKVHKPSEHLRCIVADLQEGQKGEDHGDDEAEERHAVAGAKAQRLGCAAFKCKTVQGSRGAVGVSVAGGEDGGDEQSVDDVWEDLDVDCEKICQFLTSCIVLHGLPVWRLTVVHGDDIRRSTESC